jgi:hypothetical protein
MNSQGALPSGVVRSASLREISSLIAAAFAPFKGKAPETRLAPEDRIVAV